MPFLKGDIILAFAKNFWYYIMDFYICQ